MIIIGEKLNSSVPKTLEALTGHNTEFIVDTIKKQAEAGADYIDINTALTGEAEIENMLWLIELTLQNSDCGIMLDSPDPDVIIRCIPKISGRKIIVNSISLSEKYDELIGVIKQYGTGVVCLPITDRKIPQQSDERLVNAGKIIDKLVAAGIDESKIFIDVLTEAVATNEKAAATTLETVRLVTAAYKNVNTVCGLSNISFGLPCRAKLNAAFVTMMADAGLSAAILDITSPSMADALCISDALLGNDEYCMDYITRFRK